MEERQTEWKALEAWAKSGKAWLCLGVGGLGLVQGLGVWGLVEVWGSGFRA